MRHPVATIARTKACTHQGCAVPLHGSTSAVVTCVVDDLATRIGEGPASCSPNVTLSSKYPKSIPSLWLRSRTISKSGVRRFDRVQPHMSCTNSGTAHDPRLCNLLFLALSHRQGHSSGSDGAGLARTVMIGGHFVVRCRLRHDASTFSLAVVANRSRTHGFSIGLTAKVPVPRKDTTPRHSAVASLSGCPPLPLSG